MLQEVAQLPDSWLATASVSSHWDSLVYLLQHFNLSLDLPLLWYCFLSVKSHNKVQQLGLGVLFHLH